MNEYVTIKGTLLDPVGIADQQFPTTEIVIESNHFGFLNQVPIIRRFNVTGTGEYEFKLLKGTTYTVTLNSKPQSGTSGTRNSVTFDLEIPDDVDDSTEYDLFAFCVTNFTPLLQKNDIDFVRLIENNNPYILRIENNKLIIKDLTFTRQKTIKHLFPKGGILNNNSFEYDLVSEDYTFEPLVLTSGASVNVSYNKDIPITTQDSDYYVEEDTRSLELEFLNSGSEAEHVILRQKLRPNILVPSQYYMLRCYFKVVSGEVLSGIEINVENTNGELMSFDTVNLYDDNNGWVLYTSLGYCTDDEYLLNSSQNTYFNIKMGSISNNLILRIDEIQLQEYYNY